MISVIMPVYNEEKGVANSLKSTEKALEGFSKWEIIVVDDGSTDRTLAEVEKSGVKNIRIVNHVENLGYGKSLFDGMVLAQYECIAIIDGDGSYPAHRIKDLYGYYPKYDMVVGARQGAQYRGGVIKRVARVLFDSLAEYASGRKIPDVNSGLRIFKKSIVMQFPDSLCTGFSFTTTLTLIFLLNHYYVKYVPIEYLKREGKSKVHNVKDTLRAAQIIIEAILYYNPTKLFLLIASCNTAFGLMLGILNKYLFHSTLLKIVAAICIASFVPLFVMGMIADQLKKIYNLNKGHGR